MSNQSGDTAFFVINEVNTVFALHLPSLRGWGGRKHKYNHFWQDVSSLKEVNKVRYDSKMSCRGLTTELISSMC